MAVDMYPATVFMVGLGITAIVLTIIFPLIQDKKIGMWWLVLLLPIPFAMITQVPRGFFVFATALFWLTAAHAMVEMIVDNRSNVSFIRIIAAFVVIVGAISMMISRPELVDIMSGWVTRSG